MGELLSYAVDRVAAIKAAMTTANVKGTVTADLNQVRVPCVLVVPVPRRQYDDLGDGFEATWSTYCIAPGAGDLKDAAVLEDLADVVVSVTPDAQAVEHVGYVIDGESKAALLITHSNHVTPEE